MIVWLFKLKATLRAKAIARSYGESEWEHRFMEAVNDLLDND